jgi:hypothetical protein
MRLQVASKASEDKGISPIPLSHIDGPPQTFKVAVAELQHGQSDSF